MRGIEGETAVQTLTILWLACAVSLAGCDRGGGTAESEAESPAAEASGGSGDEKSSGEAADKTETEGEGGASAQQETPAGDPIPETTARTLEGESVTIGPTSEATLVNLWATWCGPCIAEFPEFRKLRDKWGDRGLRIVGLSIQGKEAGERITKFVQNHEMPFDQVLYAPGSDPLKVFGGGSVPASFLYDAEGKLVWWHGSMLKEPEIATLESHLGDLLGSGPK